MIELSATTKLNTKKKAHDFVAQFLCNKTDINETLRAFADDKGIDRERLDLSVDSLDYLFDWLVVHSEFDNIQDKGNYHFGSSLMPCLHLQVNTQLKPYL
ncbi:hypothetical protein [Vibrio penaeicida]|uniref:hypothetical protein n=1 Tax=Vibrio penaeicida TaxID=104609 RepID=UPI001CC56922|nr:hypothetical protein [Vibrio penaeicida]